MNPFLIYIHVLEKSKYCQPKRVTIVFIVPFWALRAWCMTYDTLITILSELNVCYYQIFSCFLFLFSLPIAPAQAPVMMMFSLVYEESLPASIVCTNWKFEKIKKETPVKKRVKTMVFVTYLMMKRKMQA